jgi:hypothetical protein
MICHIMSRAKNINCALNLAQKWWNL